MKRPLAVVGFTMLFTLLVMGKQDIKVIGAVAFAALIAFVIFMLTKQIRRDKSLPTAVLSILFALIILLLNNNYYLTRVEPLKDKTVNVSGYLADLPYENNGKSYYIIKAENIDGQKSDLKIRIVSSTPLDLTPSDRITAEVKLFMLGESDDEILKYYKSKSLFLGGYCTNSNIQIEKADNIRITSRILLLRQTLTDEIILNLPNSYGAVIAGLCFGVKTYIPKIVSTGFSAAGVSHLLAVSGLHLSVWSTMLYAILKRIRVKRKVCSICSILFIAFFAFLTGLNPPVVRAGIMLAMMFSSELFKREADSINSIGFAITIMLTFNPYMATSLSLLLSVFATTGLILLMKPVSEFLNRPARTVKNKHFTRIYKFVSAALAVSISVTAATLPIYLITLPSVSTFLIISNLLMVTVGSICMTTGGLAAVFMALGVDMLSNPFLLISGELSKYLIKVSSFFADFHYSSVPINSNWSRIILAAMLCVFAVILLLNLKNKNVVKHIAITFTAVFLLANISIFTITNSKLKLTVADVGNGTAVVLKYKGRTAVICCGGDYFAGSEVCGIISRYASSVVDYLILPSQNSKNTSGVSRLSETYKINNVYFVNELMKSEFSVGSADILKDISVDIFDGELKITSCGQSGSSVKIIFGDFTAIISSESTDDIKGEAADLLICRNVLPKGTDYDNYEITVISTEKEKIDNPFNRGRVLLTSQNGNIAFLIDDDIKMEYWRAN